jgi:hypothetical protein
MSHAEHFLSRLVRLADDEVKLALALYYDAAWVRTILASACVIESAERVALSLSDEAQCGPFVVVTRSGQFVTCLARGMNPGELPIVPRERLTTSAVKVDRERQRAALEARVQRGDERLRALLKRLFSSADSISREDFLEVAALEPLLGQVFLNTYLAMGAELTEQSLVLRQKRLARRASDAILHDYWNLLHATGHMALLGSMAVDRTQYDGLTAEWPNARAAFSYPLTGTGVTTFMLKGAWAAGRLGKPMLPAYKRALSEDVALFELFDTLLVMLVLGRRSSKLRAEIIKAVSGAPARAANVQAQELRSKLGREIELVCQLTVSLLDASEQELDETLLRVAQRYLKDGTPISSDDAVLDVAVTLPLLSWTDGITDGRNLSRTFGLAAVASHLAPERFYLPRAAQDELQQPWTPDHTWKMLDPMTRATGTQQPARREQPKLGRNTLCACGSGKKHKRCCGARAT